MAEVDTALPFESVREAVSLFGGQINTKKLTFLEKRAAQDAELLYVQEQLLKHKELLEAAERGRDKDLQELAQSKETLDHAHKSSLRSAPTKSTAKEGLGSDLPSARPCGQWLNGSEDKYSLWQLKLQSANEKHSLALSQIESAKQQLTDLKQELLVLSTENDAMVKQTEEELMNMEGSVKGAESLSTELAGVNSWLSLLKHACFVASGAKSTSNRSIGGVNIGSQDIELGNEIELKLLSMMNGSLRVKEELKCAKDDESRAALLAFEVLAIVDAMRMEPKSERSVDRASLLAILEALKMQAENLQKYVVDLKERQAQSQAELGTLCSKLENVKVELEATKYETKEQATQLFLALTQAEVERAKGKTLTDSLREELSIMRRRTAAVEAKSIISVSQLSQSLKQSEADLAEARTEIADLLEAATQSAASMESSKQISQSLKQAEAEKETLKAEKQALQEELFRTRKLNAVEAAKVREYTEQLAQALKQVEAELEVANAEKRTSRRGLGVLQESLQESTTTDMRDDFVASAPRSEPFHSHRGVPAFQERMKPEESIIEVDGFESMKTKLKQALHRAEMAEARKSSAEIELRRLRERELRRKERALAYMTQQNLSTNPLINIEQPPASLPPKPHCEPLGNVLNINISAASTKPLVRVGSRRLKKTSVL
ncbi:hypothetical protein L7F22_025537 [Adiantum nelumboides]|nr:hypothetical protein [Adiantum nelumboides]